MGHRRRWREGAGLVAVAALAAAAGVARGDGASAVLEPRYTHTDTEITDQTGKTTHERADLLTQSYRLSLDRSISEHLVASAGGTLLDQRAWEDTDGVWSRESSRATALFGRLTLGTPTLSAGAGVDRREQSVLSSSSPSFVTESYSGFASWRPDRLPELDFRVGRINTYDTTRRAQDGTADSAVLSSRYNAGSYDLRYLVSWNHRSDHLDQLESTTIDQTVLGTWTDSLFGGRTAAYANGSFTSRNASNIAHGQGGTVVTQQLPVTGISAVEAFPATALNVVLTPNPLLVDGNTTATAGVDVGFGPSALGDRSARAVGARFADVVTPVNTFYVWFDRPLAREVGSALVGAVAVYQSDDNQRWTPVAIAQPPVASPFENRIEITIAQVQARYLKVDLLPLAVGVTTDAAYRALLVTELQTLLVLSAALVPRNQSTYSASANASARTVILREPDLAHDLQATVTRHSEGSLTTYTLVNGLSFAQRLTATIAANARAARQDQEVGRGHEGIWLWTAALTGNPLPTLYWNLNYSGTANDRDASIAHSVTVLARADWYEGISTQANASASIITQPDRTAQTGQAGATASLTPNRFVTVTTGVLYSRSVASSLETGDVVTEFGRADLSVSLTPAPALSAAGTVSRVFIGERPTTLATLQLNYFPLRGDLQLTFAYSKTLDTAADVTTELYGPTLRWNVRRGLSLTSTYTVLKNVAPVQTLQSRVFGTNLLITL